MTIYILDNDPAKCARMLDDKSLDKMIKDIAQVLCNVHYTTQKITSEMVLNEQPFPYLPLNPKDFTDKWSRWASECVANYKYLVEHLESLLFEFNFRLIPKEEAYLSIQFITLKKYESIMTWALDNVPDLPIYYDNPQAIISINDHNKNGYVTPFPLVMPKKYKITEEIDEGLSEEFYIYSSYRDYYEAKLQQVFCKPVQVLKMGLREEHWICIKCDKHEIRWTKREVPDFLK